LLLTLGCFLKITKVAQIIVPLFPQYKLPMCPYRENIDWATLWAILPQTRPVTLPFLHSKNLPLAFCSPFILVTVLAIIGKKAGSVLCFRMWPRVTRLGEFSPFGRSFFLWVVFRKLHKLPNFWGLLFPWYKLCINWQTWFGLHFGLFFTNSSGTDVMILKIFSPKNSAKKIDIFDKK
jgi:hypothetical protein